MSPKKPTFLPPKNRGSFSLLNFHVCSSRVAIEMFASSVAKVGALAVLASSMNIQRKRSYCRKSGLTSFLGPLLRVFAILPVWVVKAMCPYEWSVWPSISAAMVFWYARKTNSTPWVKQHTSSKKFRIQKSTFDLPAPGTP